MNDGLRKTVKAASVSFALALTLSSFAACTQATSDGTEDVDVRLNTSGGCGIAATTYGKGCPDAPPNADIPMNGLNTHALAANLLSGNYNNSQTFVRHPLTVEAFKANGLVTTLSDPYTREFLRYTLRCAMIPQQSFTLSGGSGDTAWTIDETGREGLCPEWTTDGADVACQQRVSACLLAENNPMQRHVPLSIRGAIELGDEPMHPRVPAVQLGEVEQQDFELDDRIASYRPCTATSTGTDDCGWFNANAVGYVGLCTPGDTIAIGTGGSSTCPGTALGSSTDDTVVRVCAGVRGCDGANQITYSDDSCSVRQTYLTFTCPSNAPVPGAGVAGLGTFSVMVANYTRSVNVSAVVVGKDLAPVSISKLKGIQHTLEYPAPETDVFTVREGAFFGNIFDVSALTWTYVQSGARIAAHPLITIPTNLNSPMPQYRSMFACADPLFSNAKAHINFRVCTTTDNSICLATSLGYCTASTPSLSVCTGVDSNGAYTGCRSRVVNGTSFPALTTYLHDAHDMFPQGP